MRAWPVVLSLLAAAPALAAVRTLELRGVIEPAPARARIGIQSVATPFNASALADSRGRFRFRKLPLGSYVVTVFAPGAGITRRSVDVTPGLAGGTGRIDITIPFSEATVAAPSMPRNRATVTLSELAIPARAHREFDQARKRLEKQDLDGASAHLKQAVELAPQFAMAWNGLGGVALRRRDLSEAERCFRKAVELRPGGVMMALNLGGVLLREGKVSDALRYNRLAVERSPTNALANFQLGMSYFLLEQDGDALKYLDIAKTLDPAHYATPQLPLSEIYLRRGDRVRALGELEDFLARHPDAPDAARVRAEVARLKVEP